MLVARGHVSATKKDVDARDEPAHDGAPYSPSV
jgi:hypothetical protein